MDQNISYTELEKSVELLMNVFNNILYETPDELVVTPARNNLNEIKNCLDKIFPDNKCLDILYTNNYDKLFFGIRVNPTIYQADLIGIIGADEKMKLNSYKLEFDSKLFDMGLSPQELTAYTLYEISSMVNSYKIIDDLRTVIDLNMTSNDDTIYLKDSAHYAQLIIFAIKDSLTKLSSLIYKDDVAEYIGDPLITGLDLGEFLVTAHDTIIGSENGPRDSLRASNTSILQWMFIMYRDMRTNSSTVMDALRDAKTTTGSKLDIEELNKTIDSVNRIDSTITPQVEALELPKFFDAINMSAVNEFSLFSGLKKNGLRSIEDYLYEASLRIKNLETEEDAVYMMRAINTRMNILGDYIFNTPGLSERERQHWEMVYEKFSRLREELVKKRIWNKKQYGLFFDYNQDFGDKPYEEATVMESVNDNMDAVVMESVDDPMDVKDDMIEYVKDKYEKFAGDSARWNKVTQKEIDIDEKELEAELESIEFDDEGRPILPVDPAEVTTDPIEGDDIPNPVANNPIEESEEVSTDTSEEDPNDEKESNFEDNKYGESVDEKIDSDSDTNDVVDSEVPDSVDVTIPDNINESFLFGASADQSVIDRVLNITEETVSVQATDQDAIKFLNRKFVDKLDEIINDEYDSNDSKWDNIAHNASKEFVDKHKEYDESDYAEYCVNIESSFEKTGNDEYTLDGEYFIADDKVGNAVRDQLERPFFSAIKGKIQQLCGPLFKRIDGDKENPGTLHIVLKCTTNDISKARNEACESSCCEKCGSSNLTVSEEGDAKCDDCGFTFTISKEVIPSDAYVADPEMEDDSVFL